MGIIMMKSNLRILMVEKKIKSVSELQRITKISRGTLEKIHESERLDTVSLKFIKILCELFECEIEKLIEIKKKESSKS